MSGGDATKRASEVLRAAEEELVRDEIDDNRVQITSRLIRGWLQRPAREVEQRIAVMDGMRALNKDSVSDEDSGKPWSSDGESNGSKRTFWWRIISWTVDYEKRPTVLVSTATRENERQNDGILLRCKFISCWRDTWDWKIQRPSFVGIIPRGDVPNGEWQLLNHSADWRRGFE